MTLEGETMKLPDPFIVIATQNPIEYEGTFPLPEAQLDRFIMKVPVGYPTQDEEIEILRRRRERQKDAVELQPLANAELLLQMRKVIEGVYIEPDIEAYLVRLVTLTREHRKVAVGASPRGSLALLKLTRAWAGLHGRDYVLPDDVKEFARPALIHRLILQADLWMDHNAAAEVIDDVMARVPVPVLKDEV